MRRVIDKHGLIDLGFDGYAYTWNNRRCGMANIQERRDRGFANAKWRCMYPNATITHMPAIQSNHRPLLLEFYPETDKLPKPFKFESIGSHTPTLVML